MTEARACKRLGTACGRPRLPALVPVRAALRGGRIAGLRTASPVYAFHGSRPGSKVRWRRGAQRIGRALLVGCSGPPRSWLACARASSSRSAGSRAT